MAFIDDLQNIDFEDIQSWPRDVKIFMAGLLGIVIIVLGYYFIIKDQQAQLKKVTAQEKALKDTFLEKKALAINLDEYKKQMVEAEETFGVLLKQLPNRTEVPDLLIDITQAGLSRGLQFEQFKPAPVVNQDFYSEMPVNVTANGTFHQLAEFVSDVAALPRIVNIDNFKIERTGEDGLLRMRAVTKTYHYQE